MIKMSADELFEQKESFDSVTIYLDKSKPADIVFYYLWEQSNIIGLVNRIKQLDSGTRTIVVNRSVDIKTDHQIIVMDEMNWKESRRLYAEYFFPFKNNLQQIAITGTNGKTTSCFLGMQLSYELKIPSLYIGTLGIYKNNVKVEDHYLTTPNLIDYRRIVNQYQGEVDVVWVEASSHGIHQKRLEGIVFDAIGWTSFSLDHLDYHVSMDEYFNAKLKVFEQVKAKDEKRIRLGENIIGLEHIKTAPQLPINNQAFLKVEHNHRNFSLVCELLAVIGYEVTKNLIDQFNPQVPGRFHIFQDSFVIDYAHTPDALKKLIIECSKIWPNRKLITLVGCGGDRDKNKRSLMASIACQYSVLAIFTEDNPRSEKPEQILADMLAGLEAENFMAITNRKDALKKAYDLFINDSQYLFIIAGKGEENYITRDKSRESHNDLTYIKGLHDIS